MINSDVVIVGAGISGLATAWFLHAAGISVHVVEAADQVGGVISTAKSEGFLVERGPNTTLQKPGREEDALGRLLEGTGLAGVALAANPAGKNRFILRDGKVLALPASPPAFAATRAFSWGAKARLLAEPFIRRAEREETVAQFVERRLGREFLDYAVDPFVSGVYAGDTARLSVRAAVPRIHDLEVRYGSLIRGAIALGRATKNAGMPAGRQVSFSEGMAALPLGIAEKLLPGSIRTSTRLVALRPDGQAWHIETQGPDGQTSRTAKQVVLALPTNAAADLIRPFVPKTARSVEAIPYVSIVSAGLGYRREQVSHTLNGFGFLVPRVEGVRTLGALFSSSLFDGRAPEGHVLLTAFIGGAHDPEAARLGNDDITARLHADLAPALGVKGEPGFCHLTRWDKAIPQYTIGHLDRVAEIDQSLKDYPGLFLRGSWRDGISVADCVRNGELLAQHILARSV